MATREQAGPSNRRQPVRQTRTNPARSSTNLQSTTANVTQAREDDEPTTPGFFPAITHFTDSIAALPKEMIRHYTMLKEVDAKIYNPEDMLGQMVNIAINKPRDRPTASRILQASNLPLTSSPHDNSRSDLFQHMRMAMTTTLIILDEKNHVMSTANDSLGKQLKRCESSFTHIEDEISEEARYGSMTHWAYTDKTSEKKGIMAGERTRRAAAKEAEDAAVRSEQRREAIAARKGRNHHVDSDFDDPRTAGRKGALGAKGRKITDSSLAANGIGLGINNAAGPPSKRRKVEKPQVGGLPMERALSSVYGSNAGSAKGTARDGSGAGSKKAKGPLAANGSNRRRGHTNTSAIGSPAASSPIMGTFSTASKDRQGRSPAPTSMQRVPSSRARPQSSQSTIQMNRNRSSSTNHKANNGASGGLHGTTADVEKVSGLTGRSIGEVKSSMKEAVNAKGEHLIEDVTSADGAGDMRGGLVVNSKPGNDRSSKREEPEAPAGARSRPERPASISTRGGGSKGPSANPTPHAATFSEQQLQPQQQQPPTKSRAPVRGSDLPIKRSHKKGAGLAAQLAAQAAREEEGSSLQGDDDDEDGENEPRYCYCNGVSYGEMVGCDADDCPREWFHLQCVGLTKAPAKNAKWYCDECKENLKKTKFNGGNGR